MDWTKYPLTAKQIDEAQQHVPSHGISLAGFIGLAVACFDHAGGLTDAEWRVLCDMAERLLELEDGDGEERDDGLS